MILFYFLSLSFSLIFGDVFQTALGKCKMEIYDGQINDIPELVEIIKIDPFADISEYQENGYTIDACLDVEPKISCENGIEFNNHGDCTSHGCCWTPGSNPICHRRDFSKNDPPTK